MYINYIINYVTILVLLTKKPLKGEKVYVRRIFNGIILSVL